MKIEISKAVMLPIKSLAIWKNVNKQCVRANSNLAIVNRLVKGVQVVVKRSSDEVNRSLNLVTPALQNINDTLLASFERLPPKVIVSRDIVIEQSQQAGQSQQLALRTLSVSPSVQQGKAEEEKAKKVAWWKGLKAKEKKKEAEKKTEVEAEPVVTPKINLKKEPPTPTPSPTPDSKLMKFFKTADVVKPFNTIKSLGEKAVKAAVQKGDIVDWNKLNKNIDAALGKIGEKAIGALRPVMDTLNIALTSGQLMPLIDAMANGFFFIANMIGMVVDGLLWLVGVVQENWSIIKPILEAIAIVYLAAMIVQVYLLAAAWLAANWPILAVIAVIAILIYIFQRLGISAGDIVVAIAGAFGWLKVHLQNVVIGLQNAFMVFKDYIQNLFIDPVYAIRKLFYDLAVNFLDLMFQMSIGAENFAGGFMKVVAQAINKVLPSIKKLLDLLSKVPGLEGLANVKVEYINPEEPHAVSGMFKGIKDNLIAPTSSKAVKNSEKIEYLEYTDTVNAYVQKGQKLVENFSDLGRKATDVTKKAKEKIGGTSMATGLFANQSNNLNVNKVNELGSINDSVDISSDDLKLLRELAEIQAIQNFVELTPTVQVTTGNINNAGDIDAIINKIGQKLNEEFVSTAQGVYT